MSSLPVYRDASSIMPPSLSNPTTHELPRWQSSNGPQSKVQNGSNYVSGISLSLYSHPGYLRSMLSLTRLIQKRPRHAAGIVANLPMPTKGSGSLAVATGVVASAVLVASLISLTEAFEAKSPPSPEIVSGGI